MKHALWVYKTVSRRIARHFACWTASGHLTFLARVLRRSLPENLPLWRLEAQGGLIISWAEIKHISFSIAGDFS